MIKTIHVKVTVNTETLSSEDVYKSVTITDDNNDSDRVSGDSRTFTIKADSGDSVAFIIEATNKADKVEFSEFSYKGGKASVFNPMPDNTNNWTGVASGAKGDEESYSITFLANGTAYTLDPEIEIDPGD